MTPKGFLKRALILCAAFVVCHLIGLREFTGILSGTPPVSALGQTAGAVLAVTYILLYFAVVLVVPVLIIGAGVLAVVGRRVPTSPPSDASSSKGSSPQSPSPSPAHLRS